jgi:hypothetical protein
MGMIGLRAASGDAINERQGAEAEDQRREFLGSALTDICSSFHNFYFVLFRFFSKHPTMSV